MSTRWYYQMLMEEFGPVTAEQLRDLLDEGTLNNADLVRRETDNAWTTVAAVKRLFFADSGDLPVKEMDAIGDLSELTFEFEESEPTTRHRAYPQAPVKVPPPMPMETVAGSAMQIPARTEVSPVLQVSSSRVPVSQPPDSDQPAEKWFFQSCGQVLGPMSFEELIGLGESGALDVRDRVRCGERGLWKTVDCLPRVMRAVAVGRPIVVDSAAVPVTAQKPAGESDSARPANPAQMAVEPIAEHPQPSTAHESQTAAFVESAVVQPEDPETAPTKPRGRNPRPKRRKNAKGEEELLDDIFDDVFSNESPPARGKASSQTFAASPSPASTESLINISAQSAAPTLSLQNPQAAVSSASASQESSRAAGPRLAAPAMAAAAMAAAAADRPASKSSRRSFEVNPATVGILVAVMLVAAGGWYAWQNGIPFASGNGNGTFNTAGAVRVLQSRVELYKSLGDSPSESEWNNFSDATTKELSALFKSVYAQAGATSNGAACLAATKCILRIAEADPADKELIEKNLAEFERQIVLVTE